jgi:plastocyanin
MTKIPTTIAVCLVSLALPIAGCGSDDDNGDQGASAKTESAPAPTATATTSQQETVPAVVNVSIGDNFYKPKAVTIVVGQSMKWKNAGAVAHTVTSDGDSTVKFDSGSLNPGGAYALKPATKGKLTYHCTIHGASQSGTITVTR